MNSYMAYGSVFLSTHFFFVLFFFFSFFLSDFFQLICNCKITAKINYFIYRIRSSHMPVYTKAFYI